MTEEKKTEEIKHPVMTTSKPAIQTIHARATVAHVSLYLVAFEFIHSHYQGLTKLILIRGSKES